MSFIDLIKSFDFAILEFIQNNIRCFFLDGIMSMFSYLGELGTIWIVIAIAFAFFKKTRVTAILMLIAMALAFLIGEVGLKNIVCRPRPFVVNPEIVTNVSPPKSYSFPSGHSGSSFACATVVFIRHKKMGIAAVVLAAMIAFSRIYNGVHFPSDVICGVLLGIICACVVVYAFKKIEHSKEVRKIGDTYDKKSK